VTETPQATRAVHTPHTDDGITYCGWDGHEGCGELWPCSSMRDQPTFRLARAQAALLDLNPHVFFDPTGEYKEGLIIPKGHWITLALLIRSYGWAVATNSPEVRSLLEKMQILLDTEVDRT
jgi:hypothetical protein